MKRHRVVITGMGAVSPIGNDADTLWENLLAGKTGFAPVQTFATAEYRTQIGAEVKDFAFEQYVTPETLQSVGRTSALAISAAKMALTDAALIPGELDGTRVGVVLGTTLGEAETLSKINRMRYDKPEAGEERVEPRELVMQYPCYAIAANVAMEFGFEGPVQMLPNACAAGNYAIGYSYDLLAAGEIDYAVTGGAEAFARITYTGFNRVLSLAPECCQPFSGDRKGIIIGEGAGILVLETLENALRRGAKIYAEVLGYGLGCDAYHPTQPHPEGQGFYIAITNAFKNSGITAADVDYINAHGTGTKINDSTETMVIKRIFQDRAQTLPVSSIKSMLGHMMGAASAVEAIVCAKVVQNDMIPPTVNFTTKDPECDIDCVPNVARQERVEVAISSAHAFGGNSSVVVIKKFCENNQ